MFLVLNIHDVSVTIASLVPPILQDLYLTGPPQLLRLQILLPGGSLHEHEVLSGRVLSR